MNILITGADGLLGKNLVYSLSQEHKVYALVRNRHKISFDLNNNITVVEMDLLNLDIAQLPEDMDAIYYLAQSNRFRDFPNGANDMFQVNIHAPLKIVEWARENAVKKFIYASTGGVYSNPNKPVSEFFDINVNKKQGFYPDSKLSAEILLKNYAEFFETFVIIRPFFMYGEGQNETMLIPRLINSVKNELELTISGKDGIKINPIHIDDAVQSVMKILEISGEHIINIAGKDIVSLKELVQMISKIVNINPLFKYNGAIQHDLIADILVMKEILHVPKISIEEGLRKVCR